MYGPPTYGPPTYGPPTYAAQPPSYSVLSFSAIIPDTKQEQGQAKQGQGQAKQGQDQAKQGQAKQGQDQAKQGQDQAKQDQAKQGQDQAADTGKYAICYNILNPYDNLVYNGRGPLRYQTHAECAAAVQAYTDGLASRRNADIQIEYYVGQSAYYARQR